MPGIIISEGSGKLDALFGKWQAPIASFLEARAEAIDQGSIALKIFRETKSTHWAESYGTMTAFGDFLPTVENGDYPTTDVEQGHTKIIPNVTWKNQFSISMEMLEDGDLVKFKSKPQGFMKAFERTRERFFAMLLGNAIQGNTSFNANGMKFDAAAADGVAMFSNAHKGKVSGETLVNGFKDAFSLTALGKMATAMQNMHDDNGNVMGLVPDTIIIPNIEDLKNSVLAAVGSDRVTGSANNDFNYQYGNWNVLVWPYLNQYIAAGSKPWILMDSSYVQEADVAIFQNRKPLTVSSRVETNDAFTWYGHARYSGGFADFRGMMCGGMAAGGTL